MVAKFVSVIFETEIAKSKNAPLQVIDESDKKANYLLRFCQPITDTISFIFKYIDPTDEEELINCACSTGKIPVRISRTTRVKTILLKTDPNRIISVSLTVHLWGGEGCQNLFEKKNLAKINVLLEHVTKRNQRLLLKSIRKGIQVHTCLGMFSKHRIFLKILKK